MFLSIKSQIYEKIFLFGHKSHALVYTNIKKLNKVGIGSNLNEKKMTVWLGDKLCSSFVHFFLFSHILPISLFKEQINGAYMMMMMLFYGNSQQD